MTATIRGDTIMFAAKVWSAGALIAATWSLPTRSEIALVRTSADTLARVSPALFLAAPATVRDELQLRGCLIPQDTGRTGLRNVIHGSFSGRGAKVWAALCSRRGTTTLLVLRPGAPIRVDSLNAAADDAGRRIYVAEPADMWRQTTGKLKAPQDTAGLKRLLTHQGVEDSSGCCSVVHFWDGLHWRKLPGAP
jgi:hypothetical protein